MAHLRCDFRSDVMDMNTSMTVILPEGTKQSEIRVVYLLHGLADNCSGWSRYTSVERYAREHNVALVIPEVQRSFYADMAQGIPYFTFLHEELPKICRNFFNFSEDREKNYIMGLSMGGYGALKCALNTPQRYAGVAAFSAVADLAEFTHTLKNNHAQFQGIFGEDVSLPENCDLIGLAQTVEISALPRMYLACGEEDGLYDANCRLSSLLQQRGADIRFDHWEGNHTWAFWDSAVCKAMNYLL